MAITGETEEPLPELLGYFDSARHSNAYLDLKQGSFAEVHGVPIKVSQFETEITLGILGIEVQSRSFWKARNV